MMGIIAWSPGDKEQKRHSSSLKTKEHASCHDYNQSSSCGPEVPHGHGLQQGPQGGKGQNWYQGCLSKHSKFLQDMIWEVWGFRSYEQPAIEVLKHQRTNTRSSTKKRVGTQQEEARGAEQPAGAQDVPPSMNVYAPQVKNKNKQVDKNQNQKGFLQSPS